MHTFLKLSLPLLYLAGCTNPADNRDEAAEQQLKTAAKQSAEGYDFSQDLTPAKARLLIPKAASLTQQEFQNLLEHPPLRLEEIENQSLTALLLAINPKQAADQNPRILDEFQFFGFPHRIPTPETLQARLQGSEETDYVSIIQPEYITECTCLTRGDTARGRVAFQADRVYVGQANFTAQRTDKKWQIVAFHMPEFGLLTQRQNDGTWQLASEDSLLGIEYP